MKNEMDQSTIWLVKLAAIIVVVVFLAGFISIGVRGFTAGWDKLFIMR